MSHPFLFWSQNLTLQNTPLSSLAFLQKGHQDLEKTMMGCKATISFASSAKGPGHYQVVFLGWSFEGSDEIMGEDMVNLKEVDSESQRFSWNLGIKHDKWLKWL